MMLALTHVTRGEYESMLRDSKLTPKQIAEKYGAGWVMRMQGILCAMTVSHCAGMSRDLGVPCDTADELYERVRMNGFDEIFEENGMEDLKPKDPLLGMMLMSMCQAETNDYGEED